MQKQTFWGPRWFWIGVSPSIFAGSVALFAPQDILDRVPALWAGVHWLSAIIPAMSNYMEFSQYPQVTGVTFLIAWGCFPVQLLYVIITFWRHADPDRFRVHMAPDLKTRLKFIFLAITFDGGLAWSLLSHAQDSTIVGKTGVAFSRIGLATLGMGQFLALCLLTAFLVILLFKLDWKK